MSKQDQQVAFKLDELAIQLESQLPQMQCGQCGYAGCKPYAQSLVGKQAKPNLCKPGGVATAKKLADLLEIELDDNELNELVPQPIQVAKIDASRCVGCYKCIEACPVDAIIGAHGLLHTVHEANCTGCKLCIDPCPVDCIDLVPTESLAGDAQLVQQEDQFTDEAIEAKQRLHKRFVAKQNRPSLRNPYDYGKNETSPKQLAKQAMNRAKRNLNK